MTSRLWHLAILTAIIAPLAHAAPAAVYQWNPANFKPSPEYPCQPETVTRADGSTAMAIKSRSLGWNLSIVVSKGKLQGGKEYTASLQYEIVNPTKFPDYFFMYARSNKLGQGNDLWRTWIGNPGDKGTTKLSMTLKPADDWTFTVGCKGPGTIIVDNFQIVEGSGFDRLPAIAGKPAAAPVQPKEISLPTGSAPVVIDAPAPKGTLQLSAADFGLKPDSADGPATTETATANFAAIKAALKAAREKGAASLVFPKGVYRFYSNEPIPFEDLTDLVIDGQGSEFIFEKLHPGTAAIQILRCKRTVIKNLNLDWDWSVTPLVSLGEVKTLAADKLSCEIQFPDLNEKQVELTKKAPWGIAMPMDPATLLTKEYVKVEMPVAGFETVNANTLRLTFKRPVALEEGKDYGFRHLYYEMSAFRVGDSSHLLFDNVTIYSMPGMGWVNRGDLDHWGLRNCRIARRPGSRNPFTTSADGFHVLESQGNLLIENCEFTGCGDDAMNIHDNCFQGVTRTDDHTLTLPGNSRWRMKIAPGDTLALYNPDYSATGFSVKVASVTFPGNDSVVTFAETLPAKLSPLCIVFNHRYDTSNVHIVNTNFHDTNGRGILLSARGATVENCTFNRTFATAIQFHTEIVGTLWAEGHGASNVVLRNNVFQDTNAQGKFNGAVVAASPILPAGTISYPLFHDVLIEKNRFINSPGPAISLAACKDVTVRGNRMESTMVAVGANRMSSSLVASYSSDLNLGGNVWQASQFMSEPGVDLDASTTSNVHAQGNVLVTQ